MKRIAKCECGKIHRKFHRMRHIMVCSCGKAVIIARVTEKKRKTPILDRLLALLAVQMWGIKRAARFWR